MSERERYRPFTGDDQTRYRFTAAPLEMVLCQVRWPELSYLQQASLEPLARAFGAKLDAYPLYSSTSELSFSLSQSGIEQNPVGVVHQWSTIDKKEHVSLGQTFLSVYSHAYSGWDEFSSRLERVLQLLQEVIDLRVIERVGVRYLNRVTDEDRVSRVNDLVKPEVLGFQGLPLPQDSNIKLIQALNQIQISVDGNLLQVRSGVIPPGQTVDASVLPVDRPSWVLDIDSTMEASVAFEIEDVMDRAGRLSDGAYDFFKYVIKTGFLEMFGGADINAD